MKLRESHGLLPCKTHFNIHWMTHQPKQRDHMGLRNRGMTKDSSQREIEVKGGKGNHEYYPMKSYRNKNCNYYFFLLCYAVHIVSVLPEFSSISSPHPYYLI